MYVSLALSASVRAMDADVMITIAFCLEVALVALAVVFLVRKQLVLKAKPVPMRRHRRDS
jgi:hypothetical protein